MLYEFSPGVYINLRHLVKMEVKNNKSIVIWDSNKVSYIRNFDTEEEMDMIRSEIDKGVTYAYRLM